MVKAPVIESVLCIPPISRDRRRGLKEGRSTRRGRTRERRARCVKPNGKRPAVKYDRGACERTRIAVDDTRKRRRVQGHAGNPNGRKSNSGARRSAQLRYGATEIRLPLRDRPTERRPRWRASRAQEHSKKAEPRRSTVQVQDLAKWNRNQSTREGHAPDH